MRFLPKNNKDLNLVPNLGAGYRSPKWTPAVVPSIFILERDYTTSKNYLQRLQLFVTCEKFCHAHRWWDKSAKTCPGCRAFIIRFHEKFIRVKMLAKIEIYPVVWLKMK
jgi:hypothetical protein